MNIANACVRWCLVDAALPADGEQPLVSVTIARTTTSALRR
jgi:hypothetical protein